MSEKEWIPTRGDLITYSDMDEDGIVLGWIDEDNVCILKIPSGEITTYPWETPSFQLLMSADKLKTLESWLPKQVDLKEKRPSSPESVSTS